MYISLFVFSGLYSPISFFRSIIPNLYFPICISPIIFVRIMFSGSSFQDFAFRCVYCVERFRFSTPCMFYNFDSFSSKIHPFVRACDMCTFNVHFLDNSWNGLESKESHLKYFIGGLSVERLFMFRVTRWGHSIKISEIGCAGLSLDSSPELGNRFVSFVRTMRSCVCPRDDVAPHAGRRRLG